MQKSESCQNHVPSREGAGWRHVISISVILFGENVKKQVEIAKTFTENLKIKNRLELKT